MAFERSIILGFVTHRPCKGAQKHIQGKGSDLEDLLVKAALF